MRVLVTGGSGFLGSHVAEVAAARGSDVRLLDVRPSAHAPAGAEQVTVDVRDAEAVADAVAGCDVVLHLAAVADLGAASADPRRAEEVNVGGTRAVIEACRRHGVRRLVHASSIYVHARAGGAYRDTKRTAERLVLAARDAGLPTTVLRFGSLYGPRADPANAVRRILRQALDERRIDFWGDGSEVREYVHVHDAAALAVDALDDAHDGAVLHLTGRQRVTTRELVELVAEMVGGATVTFQDRPFEGRYRLTPYVLDDEPVELGRTLLGPTAIDLGPGLLHTLHALRDGNDG